MISTWYTLVDLYDLTSRASAQSAKNSSLSQSPLSPAFEKWQLSQEPQFSARRASLRIASRESLAGEGMASSPMGLLVHHYCHIHHHYYYYYCIIGRLRWCHDFASPTKSKYLIHINIFICPCFLFRKAVAESTKGLWTHKRQNASVWLLCRTLKLDF